MKKRDESLKKETLMALRVCQVYIEFLIEHINESNPITLNTLNNAHGVKNNLHLLLLEMHGKEDG